MVRCTQYARNKARGSVEVHESSLSYKDYTNIVNCKIRAEINSLVRKNVLNNNWVYLQAVNYSGPLHTNYPGTHRRSTKQPVRISNVN